MAELEFLIVCSGPLKAVVDPIPDQPFEQPVKNSLGNGGGDATQINGIEKKADQIDKAKKSSKNPKTEKIENVDRIETVDKGRTDQTALSKKVQNDEADRQPIDEKPNSNTRAIDLTPTETSKDEVFGSLVSLNEFNPNAKQDH